MFISWLFSELKVSSLHHLTFYVHDGAKYAKKENFLNRQDIHSDLLPIVLGSFLRKSRQDIHGTGFVVQSLEAALWSFANSDNFKGGALLAANLGEDADTTAAIYGQVAGAYYGYNQLPKPWLDKLAWCNHIKERVTSLVIRSRSE